MCLVGCCPGGVASNVVSLLARADVPLSITMTTCSTVAACFLTPILAALCAGAKAELNRAALAASTVQVVLAPVALGLALRSCFPKKCDRAQPFLAPTAALLVAWICGSVVAKNSAGAAAAGAGRVLGALLCLHGLGFGLGYAAAKAAGLDEAARRTVSIETGMQNSALGRRAGRRRGPAAGREAAGGHQRHDPQHHGVRPRAAVAATDADDPAAARARLRARRLERDAVPRAGVRLSSEVFTWPGRGERASNERRPRPGRCLHYTLSITINN